MSVEMPNSAQEAMWTLAAIVESRLGNLPVRCSPSAVFMSRVEMRVHLELAHAPYAASWFHAQRRERELEGAVLNAAVAWARDLTGDSGSMSTHEPSERLLVAARAYDGVCDGQQEANDAV